VNPQKKVGSNTNNKNNLIDTQQGVPTMNVYNNPTQQVR